MSAELLSPMMDRLIESGALDVTLTPILMATEWSYVPFYPQQSNLMVSLPHSSPIIHLWMSIYNQRTENLDAYLGYSANGFGSGSDEGWSSRECTTPNEC